MLLLSRLLIQMRIFSILLFAGLTVFFDHPHAYGERNDPDNIVQKKQSHKEWKQFETKRQEAQRKAEATSIDAFPDYGIETENVEELTSLIYAQGGHTRRNYIVSLLAQIEATDIKIKLSGKSKYAGPGITDDYGHTQQVLDYNFIGWFLEDKLDIPKKDRVFSKYDPGFFFSTTANPLSNPEELKELAKMAAIYKRLADDTQRFKNSNLTPEKHEELTRDIRRSRDELKQAIIFGESKYPGWVHERMKTLGYHNMQNRSKEQIEKDVELLITLISVIAFPQGTAARVAFTKLARAKAVKTALEELVDQLPPHMFLPSSLMNYAKRSDPKTGLQYTDKHLTGEQWSTLSDPKTIEENLRFISLHGSLHSKAYFVDLGDRIFNADVFSIEDAKRQRHENPLIHQWLVMGEIRASLDDLFKGKNQTHIQALIDSISTPSVRKELNELVILFKKIRRENTVEKINAFNGTLDKIFVSYFSDQRLQALKRKEIANAQSTHQKNLARFNQQKQFISDSADTLAQTSRLLGHLFGPEAREVIEPTSQIAQHTIRFYNEINHYIKSQKSLKELFNQTTGLSLEEELHKAPSLQEMIVKDARGESFAIGIKEKYLKAQLDHKLKMLNLGVAATKFLFGQFISDPSSRQELLMQLGALKKELSTLGKEIHGHLEVLENNVDLGVRESFTKIRSELRDLEIELLSVNHEISEISKLSQEVGVLLKESGKEHLADTYKTLKDFDTREAEQCIQGICEQKEEGRSAKEDASLMGRLAALIGELRGRDSGPVLDSKSERKFAENEYGVRVHRLLGDLKNLHPDFSKSLSKVAQVKCDPLLHRCETIFHQASQEILGSDMLYEPNETGPLKQFVRKLKQEVEAGQSPSSLKHTAHHFRTHPEYAQAIVEAMHSKIEDLESLMQSRLKNNSTGIDLQTTLASPEAHTLQPEFLRLAERGKLEVPLCIDTKTQLGDKNRKEHPFIEESRETGFAQLRVPISKEVAQTLAHRVPLEMILKEKLDPDFQIEFCLSQYEAKALDPSSPSRFEMKKNQQGHWERHEFHQFELTFKLKSSDTLRANIAPVTVLTPAVVKEILVATPFEGQAVAGGSATQPLYELDAKLQQKTQDLPEVVWQENHIDEKNYGVKIVKTPVPKLEQQDLEKLASSALDSFFSQPKNQTPARLSPHAVLDQILPLAVEKYLEPNHSHWNKEQSLAFDTIQKEAFKSYLEHFFHGIAEHETEVRACIEQLSGSKKQATALNTGSSLRAQCLEKQLSGYQQIRQHEAMEALFWKWAQLVAPSMSLDQKKNLKLTPSWQGLEKAFQQKFALIDRSLEGFFSPDRIESTFDVVNQARRARMALAQSIVKESATSPAWRGQIEEIGKLEAMLGDLQRISHVTEEETLSHDSTPPLLNSSNSPKTPLNLSIRGSQVDAFYNKRLPLRAEKVMQWIATPSHAHLLFEQTAEPSPLGFWKKQLPPIVEAYQRDAEIALASPPTSAPISETEKSLYSPSSFDKIYASTVAKQVLRLAKTPEERVAVLFEMAPEHLGETQKEAVYERIRRDCKIEELGSTLGTLTSKGQESYQSRLEGLARFYEQYHLSSTDSAFSTQGLDQSLLGQEEVFGVKKPQEKCLSWLSAIYGTPIENLLAGDMSLAISPTFLSGLGQKIIEARMELPSPLLDPFVQAPQTTPSERKKQLLAEFQKRFDQKGDAHDEDTLQVLNLMTQNDLSLKKTQEQLQKALEKSYQSLAQQVLKPLLDTTLEPEPSTWQSRRARAKLSSMAMIGAADFKVAEIDSPLSFSHQTQVMNLVMDATVLVAQVSLKAIPPMAIASGALSLVNGILSLLGPDTNQQAIDLAVSMREYVADLRKSIHAHVQSTNARLLGAIERELERTLKALDQIKQHPQAAKKELAHIQLTLMDAIKEHQSNENHRYVLKTLHQQKENRELYQKELYRVQNHHRFLPLDLKSEKTTSDAAMALPLSTVTQYSNALKKLLEELTPSFLVPNSKLRDFLGARHFQTTNPHLAAMEGFAKAMEQRDFSQSSSEILITPEEAGDVRLAANLYDALKEADMALGQVPLMTKIEEGLSLSEQEFQALPASDQHTFKDHQEKYLTTLQTMGETFKQAQGTLSKLLHDKQLPQELSQDFTHARDKLHKAMEREFLKDKEAKTQSSHDPFGSPFQAPAKHVQNHHEGRTLLPCPDLPPSSHLKTNNISYKLEARQDVLGGDKSYHERERLVKSAPPLYQFLDSLPRQATHHKEIYGCLRDYTHVLENYQCDIRDNHPREGMTDILVYEMVKYRTEIDVLYGDPKSAHPSKKISTIIHDTPSSYERRVRHIEVESHTIPASVRNEPERWCNEVAGEEIFNLDRNLERVAYTRLSPHLWSTTTFEEAHYPISEFHKHKDDILSQRQKLLEQGQGYFKFEYLPPQQRDERLFFAHKKAHNSRSYPDDRTPLGPLVTSSSRLNAPNSERDKLFLSSKDQHDIDALHLMDASSQSEYLQKVLSAYSQDVDYSMLSLFSDPELLRRSTRFEAGGESLPHSHYAQVQQAEAALPVHSGLLERRAARQGVLAQRLEDRFSQGGKSETGDEAIMPYHQVYQHKAYFIGLLFGPEEEGANQAHQASAHFEAQTQDLRSQLFEDAASQLDLSLRKVMRELFKTHGRKRFENSKGEVEFTSSDVALLEQTLGQVIHGQVDSMIKQYAGHLKTRWSLDPGLKDSFSQKQWDDHLGYLSQLLSFSMHEPFGDPSLGDDRLVQLANAQWLLETQKTTPSFSATPKEDAIKPKIQDIAESVDLESSKDVRLALAKVLEVRDSLKYLSDLFFKEHSLSHSDPFSSLAESQDETSTTFQFQRLQKELDTLIHLLGGSEQKILLESQMLIDPINRPMEGEIEKQQDKIVQLFSTLKKELGTHPITKDLESKIGFLEKKRSELDEKWFHTPIEGSVPKIAESQMQEPSESAESQMQEPRESVESLSSVPQLKACAASEFFEPKKYTTSNEADKMLTQIRQELLSQFELELFEMFKNEYEKLILRHGSDAVKVESRKYYCTLINHLRAHQSQLAPNRHIYVDLVKRPISGSQDRTPETQVANLMRVVEDNRDYFLSGPVLLDDFYRHYRSRVAQLQALGKPLDQAAVEQFFVDFKNHPQDREMIDFENEWAHYEKLARNYQLPSLSSVQPSHQAHLLKVEQDLAHYFARVLRAERQILLNQGVKNPAQYLFKKMTQNPSTDLGHAFLEMRAFKYFYGKHTEQAPASKTPLDFKAQAQAQKSLLSPKKDESWMDLGVDELIAHLSPNSPKWVSTSKRPEEDIALRSKEDLSVSQAHFSKSKCIMLRVDHNKLPKEYFGCDPDLIADYKAVGMFNALRYDSTSLRSGEFDPLRERFLALKGATKKDWVATLTTSRSGQELKNKVQWFELVSQMTQKKLLQGTESDNYEAMKKVLHSHAEITPEQMAELFMLMLVREQTFAHPPGSPKEWGVASVVSLFDKHKHDSQLEAKTTQEIIHSIRMASSSQIVAYEKLLKHNVDEKLQLETEHVQFLAALNYGLKSILKDKHSKIVLGGMTEEEAFSALHLWLTTDSPNLKFGKTG